MLPRRDLVVIEAAGKLRTFYRLLSAMGRQADVLATLGHLMESPSTLRPLAIERRGGEWVETHRVTPRPTVVARLRGAIESLRGRLYIATDWDDEGHAIAADVARLAGAVRPDVVPLRLRLSELTLPSVRLAFEAASPLDADAEAPAVARRVVDRVLASAYSRPEAGLLVGRVIAGLAGHARAVGCPTHCVHVSVRAADGGRPFHATTLARSAEEAEALLAAAQAACGTPLGKPVPSPLAQPPALDDLLAGTASVHGGLSVRDVVDVLQGLYEAGVVSYPRTESRVYGVASRARIEAWARPYGGTVARVPSAPQSAHEALQITDEATFQKLDLLKPPGLQSDTRSALLGWLGRRMVEAVTEVRRDFPDPQSLPTVLAHLPFERVHGTRPAWSAPPRSGAERLSHEQVVLAGMREARLGRPSTWASHVVRAVEREIVGEDGRPGPGGEAVLRVVPEAMRSARTAAEIGRLCAAARQGVVGQVVDAALRMAGGVREGFVGQVNDDLDIDEDRPAVPSFR